jgi:hypothetical protein
MVLISFGIRPPTPAGYPNTIYESHVGRLLLASVGFSVSTDSREMSKANLGCGLNPVRKGPGMNCIPAVLLSLTLCAASAPAAAQNIADPPTRAVPWGVYQILWSTDQFERELEQQLDQLGGTPRYVLFFRDLHTDRGFPLKAVEICHKNNLIPIISFEPAPWGAADNHPGLQHIADGRYDPFFKRWGQAAARWDKTVIFRFGFEMNGDWFSWGHQPEPFKKAWRRIHRLFRQAEAHNVLWMFSPNVAPESASGLQHPLTYYPGDDVVDVVGADGYNFGDHYSRWHRWESYSAVFGATLEVLSRLNKPLFISEIGCADDQRKSAWISDFLIRVSMDRRIAAFIYYNFYPKNRGYPNWRLDSDQATLELFRKWAHEQACMQAETDDTPCSK